MTHQNDYTLSHNLVEELLTSGLEGLPDVLRILLNTAMQAEREKYLQAGEYERTEKRKGHSEGSRILLLR